MLRDVSLMLLADIMCEERRLLECYAVWLL
jgi:hypothetical protein